MSTPTQKSPPGLTRFVICPRDLGFSIDPEAEELGETREGLTLPAVIHRDRLVAGAPIYRNAQARDQFCPAIEVDPSLARVEVLYRVTGLLDSLEPAARSMLMAFRCQAGRLPTYRGVPRLDLEESARIAGVPQHEILKAVRAFATFERMRQIWCPPDRDGIPPHAVPGPVTSRTDDLQRAATLRARWDRRMQSAQSQPHGLCPSPTAPLPETDVIQGKISPLAGAKPRGSDPDRDLEPETAPGAERRAFRSPPDEPDPGITTGRRALQELEAAQRALHREYDQILEKLKADRLASETPPDPVRRPLGPWRFW